ncbi:hypothetical protein SEA_EMMA1919_14 [Streptomyces phage Emma1919]|jgi:hypothetical protein|uniref:Uncharacterized protein n=2 Tax=Gilsonvirus gilson TaxID=2846398 RepID=A0A3T0ICE0_9CAUD|nr:hypothetical protein HWB98_gp014 [Streptomyces phage Gilson]AZU97096.1 hypothetical protein SEA_GILSON_14 [Streptomyces phage Gilson]QQV92385.1 hypothetical protein SEA_MEGANTHEEKILLA_12 [Streptomyces phage MeganTheeKilla]QZE11382.1 hypothetical protein SEA_JADA_12 [Streptomyces phage Jada]URQ04632.1 hypothetical protein SEA_EMMA1919_14 [Streptomyces phage Emma1919]
MSNDKKYYQERRLWFRRYQDAKESGDEVGRKRAFKKLLQLTDNKFDGTDPNR